jgi:1-acyl-sn-glycerol-3-phosphate acyltransferase
MQQIIIEKPYKFIPPRRGTWLQQTILKLGLVDYYLKKVEGVVSHELRGMDHFRESLRQGHGILVTPNHCRYADPMVMGWISRAADTPMYAMASWHLFQQSSLMQVAMTTMGAFSVYREGVDRQSLDLAVEVLASAERPLVVFPEGSVFRTNDQLQAMLDGVAFIARTAAKKRAKQSSDKQVVIHPVAIKYVYRGKNLATSIEPVLSNIERRLTWTSPAPGDMLQRVQRAVLGVLALKEVEHLGEPQSGPINERQQRLIDYLLDPLEIEWLGKEQEGVIVPRVKALRMKILPEMTTGELTLQERDRRWKQLANIYLSQQIASYPADYITRPTTPTRILETVERLEEDLTDKARMHGPLHAIIEVGAAIPIPTERGPRGEEDPVMKQIRSELQSMLTALSTEAGSYE